MQPTYEPEDYLSRGFLGSMFGLAGRKRAASKTDNASKQQPTPHTVLSTPTVPPVTVAGSRTEADIYREIVSEARYLERSQTTTPDFSCPTSPVPAAHQPPQHYYISPTSVFIPPDSMMHHDAQKIYPPYHMVMTPTAPHPIPVDQNGVPLGNQCPMAPPPYFQHQPSSSSSTTPSTPAEIPYEVKREIQEHLVQSGNSQVSIEDIVKMVVTALKDSNIDESLSPAPAMKDESPEEILRRKRVQNNLAAARYRKRQREARDVASQELGDLSRRNEDLRSTVARMESEIAQLKRLVLDRP